MSGSCKELHLGVLCVSVELRAVILAAGLGKRMKSHRAKALHEVAGQPMIRHVLAATSAAGVGRPIVVVGHQAEEVRQAVGEAAEFVQQVEQLGTGHAVLQAARALAGYEGDLLVLYTDTPLLEPDTLVRLVEAHRNAGAAATVLTAEVDDPVGYGRIMRDPGGRLLGIVEERDATPDEARIREINSGIYCFRAGPLFEVLPALSADNAQGEYYLTDAVGLLIGRGYPVAAYRTANSVEVEGINDRQQLAWAERVLRRRILDSLMDSGVTVIDPASTFIDAGVRIGVDTVIQPFTFIRGRTTIGSGCVIGPGADLSDVTAGDCVQVIHSVLAGVRLEDGVTVGPYSHLRPGTVLDRGVKVGNFAEIKGSTVGRGSKIPHHSYVGDSRVGEECNIGAGVVTVNYDGRQKHRTVIADGAFVGCNANLIAPVTVGENAYVAAGSTVTRDVPPEALGVGRSPQENLEGWARRRGLLRKREEK